MFYVPRDRELTVQLWRAIAQRYRWQSDDPGLRPPERADRALPRHRDAQSAARAVLQAQRRGDPRGRSRPHRHPGRRAVEFELRHVRPALRRQPRLHLSLVLGVDEARLDPAPSELRRRATTCRCSWARPASSPTNGTSASASCTSSTASAGRSGPTRTSTRPRPSSRSRARGLERDRGLADGKRDEQARRGLIDRAVARISRRHPIPERHDPLELSRQSLGLKGAP